MAESMRRGVPTSSQILFDVRVEPHTGAVNPPGTKPAGVLNPRLQDKPLKRYDVQHIFPGRQIIFTDAAGSTHHGALEFEVAAYDVNGALLNSISQSIELPLSADAYARLATDLLLSPPPRRQAAEDSVSVLSAAGPAARRYLPAHRHPRPDLRAYRNA